MTQIDFKPPHSIKDALQRFGLELHCLMAWMRDEAQFHDNGDHSVLEIAQLISRLLDDSHKEAEQLIPLIERRVTYADLAE